MWLLSKLRRRIISQASGQAQAMGDYHPYGTPDTPMVMPLVAVQFTGSGAQVQGMEPLYVAHGTGAVPIPATAPGRFGHVHMAGHP